MQDKNKASMQALCDSIVNSGSTVLAYLREKPEAPSAAGLSVYQEAYDVRLTSALWVDYTGLCHLLGDAAFDALAQGYTRATIPDAYSLDAYADGFAQYVQAADIGVAATELATLECAIARIGRIRKRTAVPAGQQEAISGMVALDETAQLLKFTHQVSVFLEDLRALRNPSSISQFPLYVVVVRQEEGVKAHMLDFREFGILEKIHAEPCAADFLRAQNPDFPIDMWCEKWWREGILINRYT